MNEEKHIFLADLINSAKNRNPISDVEVCIFPKFVKEYFLKNLNTNTSNNNPKQFSDFGLYIYNKQNYKLIIRCGEIGQKGKGGHSHNDQLSFILNIGKEELIVDSGTFTYTSDHQMRNLYRSTSMHNTLYLENYEQNEWFEGQKDDLFWLATNRTKPKVIKFSDTEFIGKHLGYGKAHTRAIKISEKTLIFKDDCEAEGVKRVSLHFHPKIDLIIKNNHSIIVKIGNTEQAEIKHNDIAKVGNYEYSPNYGVKYSAKSLTIETTNSSIEWEIDIKS